MKLAMITPVYPPYRGGMGTVAAQNTAAAKTFGIDVTVFTPDYAGRLHSPEATYVKPWGTFGNAAFLPSLLALLRHYDLAHLHYTFYGADIFVWLWSLLSRKPYVLTYHMQPKTQDWRELVFRLHRLLIEPLILRRAKAVLVSSRDYAASINLQHQNLIELPFEVDTERFLPGKDAEFRAKLGIPEQATAFVFVGGLDTAHSFKGVSVLLRSIVHLPTVRNWRLVIVGDGDMRASYEELARALGVADRIIFTGALSDADLVRVYRASDVHVLPSITRSEAFGLVTLEAAATGLPSIVTNLPGVRTLVEQGVTGFVVEPNSEDGLETALAEFLHNPMLAKTMGLAARERVRDEYAQPVLATRLREVYNSATVKRSV